MLGQDTADLLDPAQDSVGERPAPEVLPDFPRGFLPEVVAAFLVNTGVSKNLKLAQIGGDVDQHPVAVPRLSHPELLETPPRARLEIRGPPAGDVNPDLAGCGLLAFANRGDDPIMVELREKLLHRLPAPGGASSAEGPPASRETAAAPATAAPAPSPSSPAATGPEAAPSVGAPTVAPESGQHGEDHEEKEKEAGRQATGEGRARTAPALPALGDSASCPLVFPLRRRDDRVAACLDPTRVVALTEARKNLVFLNPVSGGVRHDTLEAVADLDPHLTIARKDEEDDSVVLAPLSGGPLSRRLHRELFQREVFRDAPVDPDDQLIGSVLFVLFEL